MGDGRSRGECKEEAGIDLSDVRLRRPPVFHPESTMQSVIFWVETERRQSRVRTRTWSSTANSSRGRSLKYDQGSLLKKEMVVLGFGGSKRKRRK